MNVQNVTVNCPYNISSRSKGNQMVSSTVTHMLHRHTHYRLLLRKLHLEAMHSSMKWEHCYKAFPK